LKRLMLLFLIIPSIAFAGHVHKEKWYVETNCKGQIEARMPDGKRCDCLTDSHAIEYDFAPKFTEAIGQALDYSLQTGKKAGIVLILEKPDDYRHWIRLNTIIEQNGLKIDTWKVGP
jgi:hypothetical protein